MSCCCIVNFDPCGCFLAREGKIDFNVNLSKLVLPSLKVAAVRTAVCFYGIHTVQMVSGYLSPINCLNLNIFRIHLLVESFHSTYIQPLLKQMWCQDDRMHFSA